MQILLLALQASLRQQAKRPSDDDADLLARARRLDDDAWQLIFERHYPRLYSYIYYRVGDAQTAEDLCGELFERAIQNIHRFKSRDGGLAGWLTRIAQNLVRDYYRRRQTRPPDPMTLNETWADERRPPDHHLLHHEATDYLRTALQKLTPEQRDVILLRFVAQMRTPDVAALMNKTPGAIKALQPRALAALRRELETSGYHGLI